MIYETTQQSNHIPTRGVAGCLDRRPTNAVQTSWLRVDADIPDAIVDGFKHHFAAVVDREIGIHRAPSSNNETASVPKLDRVEPFPATGQDRQSAGDGWHSIPFDRQNRYELVSLTGNLGRSRLVYRMQGNEPKLASILARHLGDIAVWRLPATLSRLPKITVAFEEAITNAIIHGNLDVSSKLRDYEDHRYRDLILERQRRSPWSEREIQISGTFQDHEVTLVLYDEGDGFNPQAVTSPIAAENLTKPYGRGIHMMRRFLDTVDYLGNGNQVRMVVRG